MGKSNESLKLFQDLMLLQRQYNEILEERDYWLRVARSRDEHIDRLQNLVKSQDSVVDGLRGTIGTIQQEIGAV